MDGNQDQADPVADLQRRLDECLAEKDRRKAEAKGLRGILRRALTALLGGNVRREDYADSAPDSFPGQITPFTEEQPK